MSKIKIKHEYFRKDFNIQKTPDIVVDLRRLPVDELTKLTPDQVANLLIFIRNCESTFSAFIKEIKDNINER